MDKSSQKQRNERTQHKLVRSSEHSWFGDTVSSPATAHKNDPASDTELLSERPSSASAVTSTGSKSSTDNKTIRKLEIFKSLQNQLMSSFSRRSTGSDSPTTVKRNASCRVKGDKVNRLRSPMPSSYSSASLAANAGAETRPTTTTSSFLSSDIIKSLDQSSNNTTTNETIFKTCHLSPTLSPISNRSPTTECSPCVAISDVGKTDFINLSKSMPSTLTLSPTNPFFSSIEQHLIETSLENNIAFMQQQPVNVAAVAPPKPVSTNNPFLFESNKPARSIPPVTTSVACSKREEFLKATMKICLVVSPPSNKLQLKSRSLTHLDQLDPQNKQTNNEFDETSKSTNKTEKLISREPSTENEIRPASTLHVNTTSPSVSQRSPSSSTIKKKSSSFLQRDIRKPILTRSQISSSEYFSVCFDTENGFGDKDEIFIPATKGVYLSKSLSPALSHRSLSFSQISIIDNGMHNQFELGIPTYLGTLDGNTDIGTLAGRTLIVTERDGSRRSHSSLSKAASIGFRTGRQSRFFSSASTEEPVDDSKGTKQKQRWSLQLFGVKNPQQNQLCELLNAFTRNGVPQTKSSITGAEYKEAVEALESLPISWSDIVTYTGMSESEIKIQNVIWELVTTEVDYIQGLRTVTDLFLACLKALQLENLLTDVDQTKLFSNICEIAEANLKFWMNFLYPMVKNCRLTGQPMCIEYFHQGFVSFPIIFTPYTKYCADQSACQFYCKELNQNNALFTAYLAWCESQKMCNRLRLADILVRPMQRLTKYGLLLNAIRKHITDETDCEQMDSMIRSVDDFLCSVNAHLTARQENERLKGIMVRIEAYDVVDTNNENLEKMVKQYSTMFDLCAPMKGCVPQERHLFLEGDLKYKDNVSKIDVHCFLLTDILLICKTTAKKGHGTLKVVRQPYQTDRLQVKSKDNTIYCVYLNEFNLAIAAFTLQCSEAKNWYEGIIKAKHIYTRLKQGSPWDPAGTNHLQVKKSPLNSSMGSHMSSLNNSHSGSIELTESRNVSVDFEKTNSMSSDEGSSYPGKVAGNKKLKQTTSNSLTIQPYNILGQSMPNLNVHSTHSSNVLLVPGTSASSSGHSNLLSPSQRGISYPPPSPTRATLRRGFAFSQSIKNPPLVKTRNIQSQSFNLPQHPHLQQSSSLGQYMLAAAVTHMSSPIPPIPPPKTNTTSGQSTPKISRSSSSNETNDT